MMGDAFCPLVLLLLTSFNLIRSDGSDKTPINLLVMVPWPDARDISLTGWDAGLDLLTGARVAVKEINQKPDILGKYEIRIFATALEPCEDTEGRASLANLAYYIFNRKVAAVLGLYCSTSTSFLSPVAGSSGVDLLQLSASNSPFFNEMPSQFPFLWRFIQSAEIYAEMMVELMNMYDWSTVGLVQDLKSVFYVGIASSFVNSIKQDKTKTLAYHGGIVETTFVEETIAEIQESKVRIIFLSATATQIAAIVCEAFKNGMEYPNYVWVVADYTLDFLSSDSCDISQAMYGSIFSFFDLKSDSEVVIESSNITYEEYAVKYEEELKQVEMDYSDLLNSTGDELEGDKEYGGILYDQVWAFALALKNALPELEANNISIENYGYGQPNVTRILENSLRKVNFRGATGQISFSNLREVNSRIAVYQNIHGNSTEDFVDFCNHIVNGSFSCQNVSLILTGVDDEIESVVIKVPPAWGAVMLFVICFVIATITFTLVLTILYRKEPEVKATSPWLSLMMFVGCYFLCLAALLHAILVIFYLSKFSFSVICNFELVFAVNGCNLFFVTLFIKLFRISKIFNNQRLSRLGAIYSNCSLLAMVLVLCCLPDIILIVMISYDPLVRQSRVIYRAQNGILRNDIQYTGYSSKFSYLWLILVFGYLIVFIVLIVYLAISTRKIQNRNFKDTKKVNVLIFSSVLSLTLPISLGVLLLRGNNYYLGNALFIFGYLALATISQVMLLMPKVIPIMLGIRKEEDQWTKSTVIEALRAHTRSLYWF